MILDLCSLAFNINTETPGGNPSWGTSVGQGADYKFDIDGRNLHPLLSAMVYCAIEDSSRVTGPFGKGGNKRDNFSVDIASLFEKIYVNGKKVPGAKFLLLLVKEVVSEHHKGRRTLKYHEKYCLDGLTINADCYKKIAQTLGITPDAAWFINEIHAEKQDELHFNAFVIDPNNAASYKDNDTRKEKMQDFIETEFKKNLGKTSAKVREASSLASQFRYYLTNCLRSSRRVDNKFNYGESAVTSNIAYTDAANLLGPFRVDYPTLTSLFDITESSDLDKLLKELWANDNFNSYDKNSGQWPSTTLMNYSCFLKAREYFAKKGMVYDSNGYNATAKHQQIYFGAPGTSKSTSIKKITIGKEQHRVTFHPDTDYASFVGCYKPTKDVASGEITYRFVAQPFINAYVAAWNKLYSADEDRDVFLIIEEINRGNCAQIFGDLFQLLDRNKDGFSDYEIEPDSDLEAYLRNEFNDIDIKEPSIKSGKKLVLPPNLYIWATMNTSDQSLFPIDSAFKRRWEWKYMKIKNEKKGHKISLNTGGKYDWWEFILAVNQRIEKVTESEDKQLGYWFAKPESGVDISSSQLVGKVLFYLWNDVFKDYARDTNSPFRIKLDDNKHKDLKYKDFFDDEGEVDEDTVVEFLQGLGLAEEVTTPSLAPTDELTEWSSESSPEVDDEVFNTPSDESAIEEPEDTAASNDTSSEEPIYEDDDDDDDDEGTTQVDSLEGLFS